MRTCFKAIKTEVNLSASDIDRGAVFGFCQQSESLKLSMVNVPVWYKKEDI